MPECRYCEFACDTETSIREHLFEEHDRDELGRIDTKRVEQYVTEHGLDESTAESDKGENADQPSQSLDRASFGPAQRESVLDHGRWEMDDVRALSTDEIIANLERLGIEISEKRFREQASDVDMVQTLSDEWLDREGVEAPGYDADFAWMAATVLWERWAPNIPCAERVHDLIEEGRTLADEGELAEACDRWLTAWEFVTAVTPEDATSLEDAQRHLPAIYSLEAVLRDLHRNLAVVGDDDPAYHERRVEFCRAVPERFPDADREFRRDFGHAVAESLAELGRDDDSRAAYEKVIEEFPDDPWAPAELADSLWREAPDEATETDFEHATELYREALDRGVGQPEQVRDRLDEVEQRLDDVGPVDE